MKSKLKLFAVSILVTACAMLTFIYAKRSPTNPAVAAMKRVSENLFATSQIEPDDLKSLLRAGITAIVDLRPDGEDADQTSSAEMERAVRTIGMKFYYIPVPHGDIPEQSVTALAAVLSQQKSRALLYCRSGNRAVRTLALAEAQRAGGPSAEEIRSMVIAAGFEADDLKDQIARRIARR